MKNYSKEYFTERHSNYSGSTGGSISHYNFVIIIIMINIFHIWKIRENFKLKVSNRFYVFNTLYSFIFRFITVLYTEYIYYL